MVLYDSSDRKIKFSKTVSCIKRGLVSFVVITPINIFPKAIQHLASIDKYQTTYGFQKSSTIYLILPLSVFQQVKKLRTSTGEKSKV